MALTYAFLPPSNYPPCYDEYTAFYWPECWDSLVRSLVHWVRYDLCADVVVQDSMPAVDDGLERYRQTLWDSLQVRTQCTGYGRLETEKPLPREYLDHVRGNFSSILQASANAAERNRRGLRETVNEAEHRHDWDSLLFVFFKCGISEEVQALASCVFRIVIPESKLI